MIRRTYFAIQKTPWQSFWGLQIFHWLPGLRTTAASDLGLSAFHRTIAVFFMVRRKIVSRQLRRARSFAKPVTRYHGYRLRFRKETSRKRRRTRSWTTSLWKGRSTRAPAPRWGTKRRFVAPMSPLSRFIAGGWFVEGGYETSRISATV